MKSYVLLEIGNARVVPFVPRDLTSFVHDELRVLDQLDSFRRNRPESVRCVHPLVTLLEKLDALCKRTIRPDVEPATYVRHYEDAARIASSSGLPVLPDYPGVRALAEEMVAERQMRAMPTASDAGLAPEQLDHMAAIEEAYSRIGHMYWGPRMSLRDASAALRKWVGQNLT
jgi:hypothetical protein